MRITVPREASICLGLLAVFAGCGGGTPNPGADGAAAGTAGGTAGAGGKGGVGGDSGGRATGGAAGGAAGLGGSAAGAGGGGGAPQCPFASIPSCNSVTSPYAANGWVANGGWQGYADPYFAGGGSEIIAPPDFETAANYICIAGSVGPNSSPESQAGFTWNLNQAMSLTATPMTVTPTGSGLVINAPGTTTSMRVNLTDGTTTWCAYLPAANGGTIPWSSFKTECWPDGQGTSYAMQALKSVQIAVPASQTDNTCFCFCVVSIAPA